MELLNMHLDGARRVWVVFFGWRFWNIVWQWSNRGFARHVTDLDSFVLFLIPNIRDVLSPLLHTTERLTPFVSRLVDESRLVVEHTDFNVYAHAEGRVLIYVAGDVAPVAGMTILLHVLRAEERCPGFDNLDFKFRSPFRVEGRPAQVVFLPAYPIEWVSTGRLTNDFKVELWRRGFEPESATPTGQLAIDSESCRHSRESATMAVMRLARMANATN